MLSPADQVWNRAALEGGGAVPAEGDRALAGLLVAHGLVMNGGVLHAVEIMSPAELEAAAAGFRFFAFPEVADLLREARGADANACNEATFNQRYWSLIPDDAPIYGRFRTLFASSPESFRPLSVPAS